MAIEINFMDLMEKVGPVYSLVIATTTGAITALMIQDKYQQLNKGRFKSMLLFFVYSLCIAFITTLSVLVLVFILYRFGLLLGSVSI